MTIHLVVPSITPSTNQLMRMHWAVKRRLRQSLQWELVTALAQTGEPLPPAESGKTAPKRMVKITTYHPRRFDPDNASGGCKVLLDAMRDVGLLRNDSPKWLELIVVQKIAKLDDCRTEIEIEDMEEKA
jgi:hypothetical protein